MRLFPPMTILFCESGLPPSFEKRLQQILRPLSVTVFALLTDLPIQLDVVKVHRPGTIDARDVSGADTNRD